MLDPQKIITDGEWMLVTVADWFFAKDGQTYRSIWGRCRVLKAKDVFKFEPRQSANWVVQVGEGSDAFFVLGCQVRHAQLCLEPPQGTSVYRVHE